jgi:biotin synthase
MKLEKSFLSIVEKVENGQGPTRKECKYLLSLEPHSLESTYMMALANNITRTRFNNAGIMYAQIGIDIAPCIADCEFCSFASNYYELPPKRMPLDEVSNILTEINEEDLLGVFLMTMHNFDINYIVDVVKLARSIIHQSSQIWTNIGDITLKEAVRLKEAGVNGAYHVVRLREGEDTSLEPEDRMKTIEAIKESELTLYTCCEPIGPEHSADELLDRIFFAYDHGVIQQSAMRRTMVPSLPISKRGVISQLRLAQIVSVITLSTLSYYPQVMAVACHEPNLLGLTAGSNIVAAEYGSNPRDEQSERAVTIGMSINDCRKMLFEAGYSSIISSQFKPIELTSEYLLEKGVYDGNEI